MGGTEQSDSNGEQNETVNFEMVNNTCFMANEDKVKSDSKEITFDKLEDAYVKLEKDFKKLRKCNSSLEKEHRCCNSKIDKLLKLKDEYIAKIDSHKSVLENLGEKKNYSLKVKVNKLNAKMALQHASTSHCI